VSQQVMRSALDSRVPLEDLFQGLLVGGDLLLITRITQNEMCQSVPGQQRSRNPHGLMPISKLINPVALPPGRAKLLTRPEATGSAAAGNTIGTVRVSRNKGRSVELPDARMTSGASATNSAACLRVSSGSNLVHRVSIRILRPVIQPDCA